MSPLTSFITSVKVLVVQEWFVSFNKFYHFSEGIGRTGVVCLLEGALNLIEGKCGVYPLDMVTALRDQRPKLIQNYPLFKFACESILYLYSKSSFIHPLSIQ